MEGERLWLVTDAFGEDIFARMKGQGGRFGKGCLTVGHQGKPLNQNDVRERIYLKSMKVNGIGVVERLTARACCSQSRAGGRHFGEGAMTGYELSADPSLPGDSDKARLRMFTETRRFAFTGGWGRMSLRPVFTGPDGVHATSVISTGHRIDLEERALVTVLVPLRGRLDVSVGERELNAGEGDLLLFPPNARRTRATPTAEGTFEALVVMFPPAAADQRAGSRGISGILKSIGNGIGLSDERGIARALAAVRGDANVWTRSEALRVPDQTCRAVLLNEALENLFVLVAGHSESPRTPTAAWSKVLAAEDIMQARYDEPLAMTEVAAELGVSLRSLQAAFREARGAGPREVLNRIRLDHVRHRLRLAPPDVQVTEVALDCGFAHLGRFSQCYRKAYGEAPSETVWRRKGRAVPGR